MIQQDAKGYYREILVGADPEVFVKDGGGKLVSAHKMVQGTKEAPHPVHQGAIQVDGMALEFNVDPSENRDVFKRRIYKVMEALKAAIPEGHELAIQPVAEFGAEYIAEQPFEARQLGCEPDYDAYTGLPNVKPDMEAPFRTAAGHIHVGWRGGDLMENPHEKGHFMACRKMAAAMDRVLGPISQQWDEDEKRRELYGKWGAFRPKPYGMEYRPLSNAWLKSPHLIDVVFNGVLSAFRLARSCNTLVNNRYLGGKGVLHKSIAVQEALGRYKEDMQRV